MRSTSVLEQRVVTANHGAPLPWPADAVAHPSWERGLAEVLQGHRPMAPAPVDPAVLLDELAGLEQQIGAAQARQVELLDGLARQRACYRAAADPALANVPDYWAEQVADEVAARVSWTRWQADHRVQEARRLLLCLPQTLTELAAGRVDYPRVRVLVRATDELNPADAAAVDAAVAPRIGTLTTAQLREVLAAEIIAVDADAARRREEKATAERTVFVTPLDDAQTELRMVGPAAQVQGVTEGLDRLAGGPQGPGGEPLGVRRFDALAAAVDAALDPAGADDPSQPGDRPRRSGRAQVLVAVGITTLMGLDDRPAHLVGYGPVPAHVARRIAEDGVLRRILTDPVTGTVIAADGHVHPGGYPPPDDDRGHPPPDPDPPRGGAPPGAGPPGRPPPAAPPAADATRCPVRQAGGGLYRPRLALARLVRLRDQTCSAMGCRLPADKCDLDHLIPHPDGPTCACNLHPLCRRHHGMKTHTDWQVTMLADGSRLWTSPTGHTYLRPARPFLPAPQVVPPTPAARQAAEPVPLATTGWPTRPDDDVELGPPPF